MSIDDRIDEWHRGGSDKPLHEYLGMSWPLYSLWVIRPDLFDDEGVITVEGDLVLQSDLTMLEIIARKDKER